MCLSVDAVPMGRSGRKGVFCIITPHRTYELAAASDPSVALWVDALRKLIQQVRPSSVGQESLLSVSDFVTEDKKEGNNNNDNNNNGSVVVSQSSVEQRVSDSEPGLKLTLSSSSLVLQEMHALKQAIEERDAYIDHLQTRLDDMDSCARMEIAQLNHKLSQQERFVEGLSRQTDLIVLVSSGDRPLQDQTAVLLAAVKDRDAQIFKLSHSNDLQLKRICTLEQQLEEMASKKTEPPTPASDKVTVEAKEPAKDVSTPVSESKPSLITATGSPATPLPAVSPRKAQDSLSRVREDISSPGSGGALGSPSMVRHKTRHRRGSSVGSVVSPFAEAPTPSDGATPSTATEPKSAAVNALVESTRSERRTKALSVSELRQKQPRKTNSSLFGNAVASSASSEVSSPSTQLPGTPGTPAAPGTGEKKLVTPPPWQLKKMMENVERSSMPAVKGGPASAAAAAAAKPSPGQPGGPPFLGLKSHSQVTLLPGAAAPAKPASTEVPSLDTNKASSTPATATESAVAAAPVSPKSGAVPEGEGFSEKEKELAKTLHPMGLPTQGLVRLPTRKLSHATAEEPAQPQDSLLDSSVPKKREFLPGAAAQAAASPISSSSHEPVRRVTARSADDWAETAAKARSLMSKSHDPSLPQEAVSINDAEVLKESSESMHATPSFEGLAEKMEELMARKPSTPTRSMPHTGNASRFQEQLLEQMRAEQFELLKTIKDMKDEAEIQEMRMNQLMERIRNSEEIIDDKTAECEQQKVIIRELRKESALHRARLEALENRSRSNSVSDRLTGMKRLQFDEEKEDESVRSDSSKDSPKRDPMASPAAAGKQFILSDDDNSDVDEDLNAVQRRKKSSEYAKTVARLEDDLKKEVLYRQALEKQLTATQQRYNVEESNLRREFAEQLEAQIRDSERAKMELLHALNGASGQVDSLQKRLSDMEKKLESRGKELTRLRAAGQHQDGRLSSDASPIPMRDSQSTSRSDLLDAEMELVQKELDDKATEMMQLRKQLTDAEEARDVALARSDVLRTGLMQLERELKALRSQVSRAKNASQLSSSPTVVVSAMSPGKSTATSSSSTTSNGSLASSSEELLAHQELVASLERELDALRREKAAATSLKDAVIYRMELELSRERQFRVQARARMLRAARKGQLEDVIEEDLESELKACNLDLFQALGVSAKLSAMNAYGAPCNVDLNSLWDEAEREGLHWKMYRGWIQKKVDVEMGLRKLASPNNNNNTNSSNNSSNDRPAAEGAFTSPQQIRNERKLKTPATSSSLPQVSGTSPLLKPKRSTENHSMPPPRFGQFE